MIHQNVAMILTDHLHHLSHTAMKRVLFSLSYHHLMDLGYFLGICSIITPCLISHAGVPCCLLIRQ